MSMARWAARYCELGLALIWTPRGAKGPRHAGWNQPANAITDPRAALEHWSENPAHGIAALLEPSGLVSIDVDDEANARAVWRHFGVDLAELRREAPCIVGRHYRLLFRAPGQPLKHRTVAWPNQDEPRSSSVLFELRAGCISDTLPPTIHPGTGQPYRWENPPRLGFPALPAPILDRWRDWEQFAGSARGLCPWAPPPDPPRPARTRRRPTGDSIISAFNEAHEVSAILEAHGYARRGKRFASPGTGHAPGVVLLESGKAFCHHAGDPLSGEHAHDAFDCFRLLAHGGDMRAAVKAAAAALGLERRSA